jgi:hypothetical protein
MFKKLHRAGAREAERSCQPPGKLPAAAPVGISAVFEKSRIIGMIRARSVGYRFIITGTNIMIFENRSKRRAG